MYKYNVEISVGSAFNVVYTTIISADNHSDAMCMAEKIGRQFVDKGEVWYRAERMR